MLKRLLSILLVLISIVSSVALSVSALNYHELQEQKPIISRYATIRSEEIELSSKNGKAYVSVIIEAITGTKFKSGTLKLYKYENGTWATIKTWTNLLSLTNTFIFSNNSIAIQSGSKYKIKIAITAYTGSTSEKIVLDTVKAL